MIFKDEVSRKAFAEFKKWRESLDYDLGEAEEDWKVWWYCFLAGFKAAQED